MNSSAEQAHLRDGGLGSALSPWYLCRSELVPSELGLVPACVPAPIHPYNESRESATTQLGCSRGLMNAQPVRKKADWPILM